MFWQIIIPQLSQTFRKIGIPTIKMFYYKKIHLSLSFSIIVFPEITQSFLITSQIKRAGKRTKYTKPKQKSDFKRDFYANFSVELFNFFFRGCLLNENKFS
jgi:hypothetical protein